MIAPVLLLLSAFFSTDDALVERLGSDSWEERASAERALQGRGWAARHSLRRGLAHPDPEVRLRAGVVYAQALSREVASLGPLAEIDALWYDADAPYPHYDDNKDFLTRLAYKHFRPYLAKAGGPDYYPYANYYLATEMAARDLLEAGVPAWALRPVLAEMRRRDAVFLGLYHGEKPNPNPAPFWWWPLLPRFGPPPAMPKAP